MPDFPASAFAALARERGIEVLVEVSDASLLDRFSALEALERKIQHALYTVLNIHADVRLVEPQSLKRFEGKAKRVTDLRGQQ